MAENSAEATSRRADGLGDVADADLSWSEHRSARELVEGLIDRGRLWLRWAGPARLLGGTGALLVMAGVAWWLLRAPRLPTEAALPSARPTAVDPASATDDADAPLVTATTATAVPEPLIVHVTGAVSRPGVYELLPGQRVDDALAAAGGATSDADPNALNLAAPVADGDRIEVPVVGGAVPLARPLGGSGHTHASVAVGEEMPGPVNLNQATAGDLEQLPGIGPATAAAIVDHRTQNGPFGAVDELLDVPGIGPAKLAAIRDSVTT